VAWRGAPAARHAQSVEALKAVTDLAVDDADKREAAITVIGTTRDPKWLEFLVALREGNVYFRTQGKAVEVVVAGAKSTKGDQDVVEIAGAYDRKPLGTVPVASLTEIAADRRLRIAIKPFLDADETRAQLASPDPETRRGAALKLGHQAEAGAAPVVQAAIEKETNGRVKHALQESLALIRRKGRQDMVDRLALRVPDPDSEPVELLRAELLDHRAQAVVPAMAALLTETQLAERQSEVVRDDEQVGQRRALSGEHLAHCKP